MKKKMICMGLTLALVLGSMTTAMAAEAAEPTKAVEISIADVVDDGLADKDGLFVNTYDGQWDIGPGDGLQTAAGYAGTVDEADMAKLLEALELTETEQNALMKDFRENLRLQKEADALIDELDGTDAAGEEAVLEKMDALYGQMKEIFAGDVLEKAVALGILNEISFSFTAVPIDAEAGAETIDLRDTAATDSVHYSITLKK